MKKIFTSAFAMAAVCLSMSAQDEVPSTGIEGAEGIEAVVLNNEELSEIVFQLSNDVQGLMENQRMMAKASDVEALNEALEIVSGDVQSLVEGQRMLAKASDVEALNEAMENVTSDVQGLVENQRMLAKASDVEALNEAMEIVSSDVQGLVENQRSLAKVSDVEALADAMEIVSSDVQGLVENQRSLAKVSDVDELREEVKAVRDLSANFIDGFNDEYMVPIQEALETLDVTEDIKILSDDVQALNEWYANGGKGVVNDVIDLREAMDIVSSDVQDLNEARRNFASVNDVVALQDGLDITQEDVMNLTTGNRVNRTAINCIINALNAIIEKAGLNAADFDIPEILQVGEDTTTEIETPEAAAKAKGVYNLAGQKVDKAENGVFIVDGVKVKK